MFGRRNCASEIGRLVRFALVGFSAMAIYLLVTKAFSDMTNVPLSVASILGHIVAGFVSYLGHLFFSFRVAVNHAVYGPRFVVVAVLGLGFNVFILKLSLFYGISRFFSIFLVGITIPIFSYIFNRLWVFAVGIDDADVSEEIH